VTLLSRALLATLSALLVLVAALHAASSTIVSREFETLQRQLVEKNVSRALAALDDTLDDMRAAAGEWAGAPECVAALDGAPASGWRLTPDALPAHRVDAALLTAHDGAVAWGFARGPGGLTPADRDLALALGVTDPSLRLTGPRGDAPLPTRRGVWSTPRGVYLAVSLPVTGPGFDGPSRGVVTLGVRLDERQARRLGTLTGVGIEFRPPYEPDAPLNPERRAEFLPLPIPAASAWVRAEGGRVDCAHALLTEAGGRPAAWLRVSVPRTIARQGGVMAGYFEIALVASGAVFACMFLFTLNRWVLTRVQRLSADVDRVAASSDRAARVRVAGRDEIARLAGRINQMLDVLRAQEGKLERWAAEVDDARVAAVAANRAKSEFLANMSHEIRTPMTAILGFADLVLEPDGAPAPAGVQLDAVRTIQRNGEHLLGIINDILDLSKIEAGKMQVEAIECSPARVVEDVRQLMALRAQAAGLTLRVETVFPLPATIVSDPVRVRQILVNLVGNAIKFTPPPPQGPGVITVRVWADHGPAPVVRVACSDTGVGIPDELLPRLFSAFTQADASVTRRYGGTGLGLAICKRLAQMLGGDLAVRRHHAPEPGTTFELVLPAGQGAETVWAHSGDDLARLDAPAAEAAPPDPAGAAAPLARRVLLAEDGLDNQRLIAHVLRKAGAIVDIADNGRQAVERAAQAARPFDLVILDMQMPEMDGYAAAGALRRMGHAGPIIALTAHAMAGDREKCLRAGCSDFLTKPIDRARLVERCRYWSERAHAEPPAAAA
jgi:signal transduction histidine kinase/ActR/RegA family two-component response regulator